MGVRKRDSVIILAGCFDSFIVKLVFWTLYTSEKMNNVYKDDLEENVIKWKNNSTLALFLFINRKKSILWEKERLRKEEGLASLLARSLTGTILR